MSARPNAETPSPASGPTRARLLDAAAACFAAHGYAGTSVRDITARAACNVGAVNYHFGGKRQMYAAVFEQRLDELRERRVGAVRALVDADGLTLERVIETFAHAFLEPLQSGERGRQTMMLLMRDMVDGHLPADLIDQRMIRPTLGALMDALERAGAGLTREQLIFCCHSLVSQLVHVVQMQRLHARNDAARQPGFSTEDAVAHIVRFTAAGMRGYADSRRA